MKKEKKFDENFIEIPRVRVALSLESSLFSRCANVSDFYFQMRENSLLVLLQALMTFPSTTFPPRVVLQGVSKSCADPRRRVRHAALEVLSVLSQFLPTHEILECASKVRIPDQKFPRLWLTSALEHWV